MSLKRTKLFIPLSKVAKLSYNINLSLTFSNFNVFEGHLGA